MVSLDMGIILTLKNGRLIMKKYNVFEAMMLFTGGFLAGCWCTVVLLMVFTDIM